jgi:hypothetical protein
MPYDFREEVLEVSTILRLLPGLLLLFLSVLLDPGVQGPVCRVIWEHDRR